MTFAYRIFTAILLAGCFTFLSSVDLWAQSYAPVGAGSKFLCAFLPNGKNKLVERHGKKYDVIGYSGAAKTIKDDITIIKARLRNLEELRKSVIANHAKFTGSELAYIGLWFRQLNGIKTKYQLPKSTQERLELIQSMVTTYQSVLPNRSEELNGIAKCKANVRPKPSDTENQVFVLKNGNLADVILLSFAPATDLAYCLKPTGAKFGSSFYAPFSKNPCDVTGGNCSAEVPKDKVGYLTGDITLVGFTDEQVNAAINQLEVTASIGFEIIPFRRVLSCDSF